MQSTLARWTHHTSQRKEGWKQHINETTNNQTYFWLQYIPICPDFSGYILSYIRVIKQCNRKNTTINTRFVDDFPSYHASIFFRCLLPGMMTNLISSNFPLLTYKILPIINPSIKLIDNILLFNRWPIIQYFPLNLSILTRYQIQLDQPYRYNSAIFMAFAAIAKVFLFLGELDRPSLRSLLPGRQ